MAKDRKPVSFAVLVETAISLALDDVRAAHPGSVPADAELMAKRTLRVTEALPYGS